MLKTLKTIWDFSKERKQQRLTDKKLAYETAPDSPLAVAGRFVQLFEAHGVLRTQIAQFFDHGLLLEHFHNLETLLPHLTEGVLADAATLFCVRREWLDGEDDEIYYVHDFYKQPEQFLKFIGEKFKSAQSAYGTLLVADGRSVEDDAIIILQEELSYIGERCIYRNHLCGRWAFNYWKCRAYLAACIDIAEARSIYIKGRWVSEHEASSICQGTAFPKVDKLNGGLGYTGGLWHADDLVYRDDVFVKGLNEGEFGRVNALALKTELKNDGFIRALV